MDTNIRSDHELYQADNEPFDEIDKAIICLYASIETFGKNAYPENYYSTIVVLGDLFSKKVSGDPDINLIRSIACRKESLNYFTKEKYPEEYDRLMCDINIAAMGISAVLVPFEILQNQQKEDKPCHT